MRHYKHAVNSRRKHIPAVRQATDLIRAGMERGNSTNLPALRIVDNLLEDLCQDNFVCVFASLGIDEYFRLRPSMSSRASGFRKRMKQYGLEGPSVNGWDLLALYVQHGKRCVYCGSTDDISFDHKEPLSKGGANTIDNLALACKSCNSSKGVKELKDADRPQRGWRL